MKTVFKLEINQLILRIAAALHFLTGLYMLFFPNAFFSMLGMHLPYYKELWQGIGCFYIAFALGYLLASFDPGKHWVMVLVGLLTKVMITLGFFRPFMEGKFPLLMGGVVLFSEVLWLVPFYFILEAVYDEHSAEESSPKKWQDLLNYVRTNQGQTLNEVAENEKVLLVFIRQFGCLFCRENVIEMGKFKKVIEEKRLKLVFVHMGDPAFADEFFSKYYTHPVTHISDPGRQFYRALNLSRGSLAQLFGPINLLRGLWVSMTKGIVQGKTEGDPLQLGGVFLLNDGKVVYEQKAARSSTLFKLTSLPEL